MSLRRANTLVSVIALMAVLIQLMPSGAAALAVAKPIARAHTNGSQEPSYLFRATVTLEGSRSLARLEKAGVLMLGGPDAGQAARVLVDGEQLAELARVGFRPRAVDELRLLVASQGEEKQWLAESFATLFNQGVAVAEQQAMAGLPGAAGATSTPDLAAMDALRAAVHALTPEQIAGTADSVSVDDDADGLTNTQEAWWCTDAIDADTDDDGRSDGSEIQALKDWMDNARESAPGETPWPNWPFNKPACPDEDHDSIPDLAEQWELGLNRNLESSDRDRFDDGQELFGITYCPGGDLKCGYGAYPRSDDSGFVPAALPSWVKAPGKHPMVGAFPMPEVDVASLMVQTRTTVTTNQTISEGTEQSYSTMKTEGTSTSSADVVTWNDWEETAISAAEPIAQVASEQVVGQGEDGSQPWTRIYSGASFVAAGAAGSALAVSTGKTVDNAADYLVEKKQCTTMPAGPCPDQVQDGFRANACAGSGSNALTCREHNAARPSNQDAVLAYEPATYHQARVPSVGGTQYHANPAGDWTVQREYPVSYPLLARPIKTAASAAGSLRGGSQNTTTYEYEEHVITNGEAFSGNAFWDTATADNSAHAADLWFKYEVRNSGTEYAREIRDLSFGIYIGDDPDPICSYHVGATACGAPANAVLFKNFMPDEVHTDTSYRIPLTLEQMKAVDLGGPIRIVLEDFTFGADELFYQEAANADVLLAVEDGTDDGDEAIDAYFIPTWEAETVLDVLARYFPHEIDANGMIVAVWTPEYRSDTPAWCREPSRIGNALWCKHALSPADWWNIYTDGAGDGSGSLQDTLTAPGQSFLFRFNTDADLDGYSDRSEGRLTTDPSDSASFPKPELIGGLHNIQSDNLVTSTLSLHNIGRYDAYDVEAVMIAPDNSVHIANNTVGGSGRVAAQKQVIVGSRSSLQNPLPAAWTQAGHAQPVVGGYYSGPADRTYTFTVSCPDSNGCEVASGAWSLDWSDGKAASGSLDFGDGYRSPNLSEVGTEVTGLGIKLGLLSGKVYDGEAFTVDALTPRDTFQYTIAEDHESDFTPPIVVVSYNDPQGNHRFAIPPEAMDLESATADLTPFAGQMLLEPGVEIVTSGPLNVGGNTTDLVINNPAQTELADAHLFLEFIDPNGVVVAEVPVMMTLPAGPTTVPVDWATYDFWPAYSAEQDYVVMAFWTDYEGNIVDTAARPLASFQEDPRPAAVIVSEDEPWEFGTAKQGTLMQRRLALANVGYEALLTQVNDAISVTVAGPAAGATVLPGDTGVYKLTLNTQHLPVGPFEETLEVRTNDPANPAKTITIRGDVTPAPVDAPAQAAAARVTAVDIGADRPLDWTAVITGAHAQGEAIDYTDTLEPDPASIHPCKVYDQAGVVLKGVGKYCSDFGQGTAPREMFGNGSDGSLTISADTVDSPIDSACTGAAESYTLFATNTSFAPGQVILIHQSQGTGAGAWMKNEIAGYSPGRITLSAPLNATYTPGAQVLVVKQYTNVTVNDGVTWTAKAWNGATGGILAFAASGTATIDGTISARGRGFRSGAGATTWPGATGYQGESTNGTGDRSTSNNQTGGGGGSNGGGGGGGGHAAVGIKGENSDVPSQSAGGTGGGTGGTSDLGAMVFGGAGGGGGAYSGPGGNGGRGGGILLIDAATLNVSGSVTSGGESGQNGPHDVGGGGGGGAGGSVSLKTRVASLGSGLVSASGGSGGAGFGGSWPGVAGTGGSGGVGRIHARYCSLISGATNPTASLEKLNCYIAEQVDALPYTTRLYLPDSTSDKQTYLVQYGRRFEFFNATSQSSYLRVSRLTYGTVSLDVLVSNTGSASGNLDLWLDIGNDGECDYHATGVQTFPLTLSTDELAGAFNDYLVTASDTPWGDQVDVPVRVQVDRRAEVMLTNLALTPAGEKTRFLRLPAESYDELSVDILFEGDGAADEPLSYTVDVGADGNIEWSGSAAAERPVVVTSPNLAAAFNEYLAGKTGEVDVPIRIKPSPAADTTLAAFRASATAKPDLALAAADITFGASNPVEGDHLALSVKLHNDSSNDSGPLTAGFYATSSGGGERYIGSAFVLNVPAGRWAQTKINWNTLGFAGDVPVRVVVDPFNRVAEASETNNEASATKTIRTRPDLHVTGITLSDDEPMVGETLTATVTLENTGQTAAPDSRLALYDGNPDNVGALLAETAVAVAGRSEITVALPWTPSSPGLQRLFGRADEARQVNETDEGNNDSWRDVRIGLASPIRIDSGAGDAYDPAYSEALGFGYLDDNFLNSCDTSAEGTQRTDYDGDVRYRFDHLLPGHFYHLDLTLYACDGLGRQERVRIDENYIGDVIDLSDLKAHRLSLRLDPALYADRSIVVGIEEITGYDAVVSEINLYDIDYRYADAGASSEPAYTPLRGYGFLDGVAQNTWGTLPYQTRRIDLSDVDPNDDPDNEVRYRFDRLNKNKLYQLRIGVYQGAGETTVQQSVAVDGVDTGVILEVAGIDQDKRVVDVPPDTYADDNTITVRVARLGGATAGAFISEIALEELTLSPDQENQVTQTVTLEIGKPNWISLNVQPPFRPAAACSDVMATGAFTTLYGDALVGDAGAPVGSLVEAFTPEGVKTGCFRVASDGSYGHMRVYGAEGATPGMQPGDPIILKINGIAADPTPHPVVWQDDKATREIDLIAPDGIATETLLAPIIDKVTKLQCEDGIYLPPPADPRFNACTIVEPGRGYVMWVSTPTELTITGNRVATDKPLLLHDGYNWLGYLPTCKVTVAAALDGIGGAYDILLNEDGTYRPSPADPAYNNLDTMGPGEGYMIHMNTATTLIYPADLCGTALNATEPTSASALTCPAAATTRFTHFYGHVTPTRDAPPEAIILAYSPRGEIVGCAEVQEGGLYPYLRIYGADDAQPGMQPGEVVHFTLNGRPTRPSVPAIWQDDWDVHPLDLTLDAMQYQYFPLITR